MPHLSQSIANSFLDISKSAVHPIDPMKVQKLVYFAHGWHLGYDRGALSAEKVEAWRWGPVFPNLYQSVKKWGNSAIMEPIRVLEMRDGHFRLTHPRVTAVESFEYRLIKSVWNTYGHMSGIQLSQFTHEEESPWRVIRDKDPDARSSVIPNDLIYRYFRNKIPENARS